MGARVNFVFDDSTDSSVVLYSHWGADHWKEDLARAINHARPRWSDSSYCARMIISHLMRDQIDSELNFGIYALPSAEDVSDWDLVIRIDVENSRVEGEPFEVFVADALPLSKVGRVS